MKTLNIRTRKLIALTIVLTLMTSLSGCDDADKALAVAAATNREVQTFAIAEQRGGRMTLAETKVVVDATERIGKVGLSAVAVVEQVKKDQPDSRTAALDALGLVVDEVGKLQKELGIKNETSRHHVEGLLAAIQTYLNTARTIIATNNVKK